jgi:hypothetical protein
MTTRPQPGLPQDNAVLRAIIAELRHCLSVYCNVVRPGTVRVGDVVTV